MAKTAHDLLSLLVADIFHAAGELRRVGEAIAAEAGQTQARWQLMSVVSEGEWTVPDAARRLGVSRQAVQRIADELVAEKLAVYAANPRHQRSPFLQLTPRGAAALDAITSTAKRSNQKVARLFTPEELARTRDTLRRIVAALQEKE